MWNLISTNKIIETQQHIDVQIINKDLKKAIKIAIPLKTHGEEPSFRTTQTLFKNSK